MKRPIKQMPKTNKGEENVEKEVKKPRHSAWDRVDADIQPKE